MHFRKNEFSGWKIYTSLLLILGCNIAYCFIIYTHFTVEEANVLYSIRETRHLANGCLKTCDALASRIDALKSEINNKSVTNEPIAIPSNFSSEIKNLQREVANISNTVTHIATENKKLHDKLNHNWKTHLLKLLNTGIHITKIKN